MKTLTLPWPDRSLFPNVSNGEHWGKKSALQKKLRFDCGMLAKGTRVAQEPETFSEYILLILTFCPPDNRRRDLDGCLSAFKGGVDGLADTWGVDDYYFKFTIQRGSPVKGGAVIVHYEEA